MPKKHRYHSLFKLKAPRPSAEPMRRASKNWLKRLVEDFFKLFAIFVFTLLISTGCKSQAPLPTKGGPLAINPAPFCTPVPSINLEAKSVTTYTVAQGDCLWNIAKKDGDPFVWPLIWKANRDLILDPDWIEPGMDLDIPHDGLDSDIVWADGFAKSYPSHPAARSTTKP